MVWNSVKDLLPDYGVYVEVILANDGLCPANRGFAALWRPHNLDDGKTAIWVMDHHEEETPGEFQISHWRQLNPDPEGKWPYLSFIEYGRGSYDYQTYFK